nr:hypothetical protein 38 [bacterium]
MEPNHMIVDMPPEEYHTHPAVSKSGLDMVLQSPGHYVYYRDHGFPDTDALNFGSAFHTLLLEPEHFASRVHVWSGKPRNTKAGKAEWEAAQEVADGRVLIKQSEHDDMKAICEAISAHVSARVVLTGKGRVEPSLFWMDEVEEVECRCRPDWMREDGLLVDLKSAIDASPEGFMKAAFNHGYHMQAAMYLDGYRAVTGKEPAGFVFVAAEKKAPYGVGVYMADADFIELGRIKYREALTTYAGCLKADKWPMYPDEILPLNLPPWAQKQLDGGNYV